MPKKREQWWVSKLNQTLGGQTVIKGQLVKPMGNRNDHLIFQDNTHWVSRFDGSPILCDTDGCPALFANDHSLEQHRLQAHAPERDARERQKIEAAREELQREQDGETIGGHPVEKMVPGPRGTVPYIS